MNFEDMMASYLDVADENQKILAKRNNKKAGTLKHKCSKGNYELDVDHIKQDDK